MRIAQVAPLTEAVPPKLYGGTERQGACVISGVEWLAHRGSVGKIGDTSRLRIIGAWALGLPFIIIFGLKFGVFTPTEAAVVAAVYSLFVATCIYRELKVSQLYGVFVSAALTTSVAP